MATKKNEIKKVAQLMINGLEEPVKNPHGKGYILQGEYVTIDADPTVGDVAFIVNGEEGDRYAYFVNVTAVDLNEI